MRVYGIKNCDSVKKALKFLDANAVTYDFVDLKQIPLEIDTIKRWLVHVEMKKLFNTRSTTYRNLGLKEMKLDDEAKIEWLLKEPMLIKRPVIECDNGTLVGFDQNEYKEKLL